jgi:hypothetical protein
MPELTDDESDMISEYAAGLLLKYSPNYDYRIVDNVEIISAPDEETEDIPQTEENTEEESSTETSETQEESTPTDTDVPTQEMANVEEVSPDTDIAKILGINDVSIKYSSYEICDSYPKDSSGFSVSAHKENKLLVVHFNIENTSGAPYTLNLLDYNMSARLSYNGDRSSGALNTMLPNDLLSYYDTISTDTATDAVILALVSNESAQDLSAISVKIATGSDTIELEIK